MREICTEKWRFVAKTRRKKKNQTTQHKQSKIKVNRDNMPTFLRSNPTQCNAFVHLVTALLAAVTAPIYLSIYLSVYLRGRQHPLRTSPCAAIAILSLSTVVASRQQGRTEYPSRGWMDGNADIRRSIDACGRCFCAREEKGSTLSVHRYKGELRDVEFVVEGCGVEGSRIKCIRFGKPGDLPFTLTVAQFHGIRSGRAGWSIVGRS